MYKYADYIALAFIIVWAAIYNLFGIPFKSLATGIILLVLVILSLILLTKEKRKENKEENKSQKE